MEEAERFYESVQPATPTTPSGLDGPAWDLRLPLGLAPGPAGSPNSPRWDSKQTPSYAKDTQSSFRKKPRRATRRGNTGLALSDEGEDEAGGGNLMGGGVGMKGKSCYLVSMRLKALPIADATEAVLARTSSGGMGPSFGGGRDGVDKERVHAQLSLSSCSRVEYLYLRGNLLRGLWDTRLTPNLIVLDVSENELESLDGIEHLRRLEHLYVNSNAVTSIDEVPVLPKLAVLSLSCNRISALERMQHQPSLELLSLADNNITSIAGLVACPHLVGLRLRGNPISKAPGYRMAVLLSAAACGMMELAKLDGQPFQDIELAQTSCLAWPQRLSALYGWIPG
jgi:hypothetical protein